MPDYTPPPSSGSGGSTSVSDADANTKIQVEESSDENKIRFDTAGSERMIIDENGNVGIGTTSPDFPLHLVDDTAITSYDDLANAAAVIESTDDGVIYGPVLKLYRNAGTAENGNYIGMIRFTANANNQFGAGQVEHLYARIFTQVTDITGGGEDGTLNLEAVLNGQTVGRLSIGSAITVNGNLSDSDFIVHGSGGSAVNVLKVDAGLASVGIRTSTPVATLDVASGQTFRSTRLLTVSITSTPVSALNEADHAGRYIFVTGASTVITLPDNQAAGVHFTLLSNDANGFTLRTGTGSSDGDNMNGAQTDITVSARNGVTAISTGTDYVVLGV